LRLNDYNEMITTERRALFPPIIKYFLVYNLCSKSDLRFVKDLEMNIEEEDIEDRKNTVGIAIGQMVLATKCLKV